MLIPCTVYVFILCVLHARSEQQGRTGLSAPQTRQMRLIPLRRGDRRASPMMSLGHTAQTYKERCTQGA